MTKFSRSADAAEIFALEHRFPLVATLIALFLAGNVGLTAASSGLVLPFDMIPRGKDWLRHLLIVALCLAAVLVWMAAGTIFDRPVLDEAAQTDD